MERPPDAQEVIKGHGRLDIRRLWVVPLDETWRTYCEKEVSWPQAQYAGVVERKRRILASGNESQECVYWIAGGAFTLTGNADYWQQTLRNHWDIENGLFHVRDVTFREDQHTARYIARPLVVLRNVVITLLRRAGYPYIPDGLRHFQAHPEKALPWLLFPHPTIVIS